MTISSYALFATIGLCVAVLFIFLRSEQVGLDFKSIVLYIITCFVCGAIVARLVFVIAMIPSMNPLSIDMIIHYLINGGIVFYGGLIGVIIGIIIVSKMRKVDVMNMLDFITPAFPLFHFFARIGCIFAGCCYGIPCSWGVVMQGETIVRFPVQFFESLCNLLIFVWLEIFNRKTKSNKHNFAIYMCSYAVCRFGLEFFRGDTVRGIWNIGLSTSQCISLLIIFTYTGIFFKNRINARFTLNKKTKHEFEMADGGDKIS